MNRNIILPNGAVGIEAQYKKQLIEEFENNPFIESLPDIISKEEIIKKIQFKPTIKKQEIELDKELKMNILPRLYKVFQPLPIHVDIWNMINRLIRQGYISRNPFNPTYKKYINSLGDSIINNKFNLDSDENFRNTAQCGLLIGMSGMGKTTTTQRVLSNIPQVIVHQQYNNVNFNQMQVTWLKLEAPHNGSIKALTLQFFSKLDDLLGTNNMKRYVSSKYSTDILLPLMGQCANSVGLGLLVIDELQHLNKNSKQVMNYLVALMNSFGVPILLIGTPACYSILQNEMRIARRVTGAGTITFNNMDNDKEFEIFIRGIWKYQWTNENTKLSRELVNKFYEKTQGLSDLVVKLFFYTQIKLIEKGHGQITEELIDKVWDKEFKLINPMINAIKDDNLVNKFKYEDIQKLNIESSIGIDYKSNVSGLDNKKDLKAKEAKKHNSKKIKIDDLEDYDIRKIILKNNEKSVHELLKEYNFIKSLEEILC